MTTMRTDQAPSLSGHDTETTHASSREVPSKKARIAGRVLSGIAVAFLGLDAVGKLFTIEEAVRGTVELGYPASALFGIGVVQAICLVVYLIPQTAVVGAVLWTGYLGGAIATHVRMENPLFTHVLFPIYVAAFLWGGLWLREPRLKALAWRSR